VQRSFGGSVEFLEPAFDERKERQGRERAIVSVLGPFQASKMGIGDESSEKNG
tara:strand:- start:33 stop:191 length:159 start_codon:yes stop_codon:yes gene_type:complete